MTIAGTALATTTMIAAAGFAIGAPAVGAGAAGSSGGACGGVAAVVAFITAGILMTDPELAGLK
jgi:hypothetical protein